MFEVILFLFAILGFVYLNSKINNLRNEIKTLKGLKATSAEPVDAATRPIQFKLDHERAAETDSISRSTEPREPDSVERFFHWLSIDWPLKLGAFLVIIGFAWLITYAFMNNWIGPTGRITLGLLAGSGILIWGHFFIRRSHQQGLVLQVLGNAITLTTIYAAQAVYDMFPAGIALAFGTAPMLLLAYSSLVYQDRWIAFMALVSGGLAPLLTHSDAQNIVGLYGYLLALCIGVLWLARYAQWHFLTFASLLIVTFYSLPYLTSTPANIVQTYSPAQVFQLHFFAITFTSLFFFGNLLSIVFSKKFIQEYLVTAIAVGAFALGWINALTPVHFQSLVALEVAVAFSIAAFWIANKTANPNPVYTYSGVAVVLLTAAAYYQFDGNELFIVLSVIAAVVPVLSVTYFSLPVTVTTLWYYLLPVTLSLPAIMSSRWERSIVHPDNLGLIILTLSLACTGSVLYLKAQQLKSSEPVPKALSETVTIAKFFLIIASGYALLLIWLYNQVFFQHTYQARVVSLIAYTLIGITTLGIGQFSKRHTLYRYGQFVTLAVIAWLFLVEVWQMELVGRIIAFLFIGILLMASVLAIRRRT